MYSHCMTAAMALDRLDSVSARRLTACSDAYFIGAQGPDPFLFMRISLFRFLRACPYGGSLHVEAPGRFFASLLEFAQGDPIKTAYACGYLTHYALDCAAHPYVYSRCCNSDHTRFEEQLDMAMLREQGVDPADIPGVLLLPYDSFTVGRIDDLMSDAISHWCGERAKNVFRIALSKMRLASRLTYDPKYKKYSLLRKLGHPELADLVYAPLPDACHDILNLSHRAYTPYWGGESRTLSFPEMMELGADDAAKYIRAALDALSGGSMEEALKAIGSRNFGTGRENDPLITTGVDECCFGSDCCEKRKGEHRSPTV